MIDFACIDTVLLDLDGTLLDKYFDDYFWQHLVPEKYAIKHDISFGKAKERLFELYDTQEGTLNWTDIDFWSRELDLDIPALKEQIAHLIDVHPNVEQFLTRLRQKGKQVYLVTNAHYKVLDLKMAKTKLAGYFDKCFTSFELQCPKEQLCFWQKLEELIGFDKGKTLLIDDTVCVLQTAQAYGIRFLLHKTKSSSRKQPAGAEGFETIEDFSEIMNF